MSILLLLAAQAAGQPVTTFYPAPQQQVQTPEQPVPQTTPSEQVKVLSTAGRWRCGFSIIRTSSRRLDNNLS
jgi:hypothetical protein